MSLRSSVAGAIKALRYTPLHPQWLLGDRSGISQWVRSNASGVVLDIGCADSWIRPVLRPECQYIGLDYPATGADLYRAKPEIFADGAQLPLVDGCIDTVTILEVAEHLSDYRKALVEISRVLRPQGRMLLTMPFLYPIHDAPHDYQRLTIYGLARDVEHAGLRIDSLSTTLGSAQTAGLLSCLALAGMSVGAIKERSFGMIWVPPLLLAIPVINVTAWLVARLLPSWNAITAGYRLSATKL